MTCKIVPDQNGNNRNAYTQSRPSPLPPEHKFVIIHTFYALFTHHKLVVMTPAHPPDGTTFLLLLAKLRHSHPIAPT